MSVLSPLDNYNQQVAAVQAQLSQLQQRQFAQPAAPAFPAPVHNVPAVDGIAGAEALLKELPPGCSEIAAHRSEDIIYLLARDKNGTPMPIKTAKVEFIEESEDPSGYVTRKDFDAFRGELRALLAKKGEAEWV